MNFKNNEIKRFPSEEDILSLLSDQDIFNFYLEGKNLKLIPSPLRNDKIPSFGLFYSKKYGRILYKDLANGDVGNCFVFVKKLFGLSKISDAYNKVAYDFNLNSFRFDTNVNTTVTVNTTRNLKRTVSKETINIKIKVRAFNNEDRNFWYVKYGINLKMLKHCNVFPISHYFLNDYCVKVNTIAYAFLENKDGVITYKIYQPFGENKWINNNNYSVWELWTQMPQTGDTLIIASSRKDSMVIKSLFKPEDITSCSLQGENFKPKRIVMEELSSRFKHKLILYDNDKYKEKNWGKIAANKICMEFADLGFKQIEIPDRYEEKDISDFREKEGEENSRELIINLRNNVKKEEK